MRWEATSVLAPPRFPMPVHPAPSSRRHDVLLDRLLAPASGLMSRLRFGQKAMVIGASFVVTCAVLGGIVVSRANAELRAAHLQASATTGLMHLHRVMLAMQDHNQWVVRRAASAGTASLAARRTTHWKVATELDAFQSWQQALPGAPLQQSVQAIRDAWTRAAADHA